MSYPKPWKSYADQLDQLIDRGMAVTDRARALDYLERIGYYRLSGYWFAFRERSEPLCLLDEHGRKPKKVREERIALDAFRAGTTFQNAVDLYVFDKQLRLLVMDALERIEVALRVDVSHTLGQLDRFAYLKPELFHDEFSVKLDKDSGVTLLLALEDHPTSAGRGQSSVELARSDESASARLPRSLSPRPEPGGHGRPWWVEGRLVSVGNKKPLSSFPAEAESPRGAVLPEILGYRAGTVNVRTCQQTCTKN